MSVASARAAAASAAPAPAVQTTALSTAAPTGADSIKVGRMGEVRLFRPQAEAAEVVLFFSDEQGWNATATQSARQLAAAGAWVAGIDSRHLLAEFDSPQDKCVSLPGEAESLSHYLQGMLGLKHYLQPSLAGSGTGAALAYATLVAAPANLFKGALSDGFCPFLPVVRQPCKGRAFSSSPRPAAHGRAGAVLLPTEAPGGRWIVRPADAASCKPESSRAFVAKVPGAHWDESTDALPAAFRRLVAPSPSAKPVVLPAPLRDLPLAEIGADKGPYRQWFAVVLSGDGGWVGVDRGVGEEIARHGIPVVGWDTLRYFWSPRTPQGAAADLDRVLLHYARSWGKSRALLLGYSQGADTLPFMANRLSPAARDLVGYTALIATSEPAYFEFEPAHWLGKASGGLPILPELEDWGTRPYLCLYGARENDSLCPQLAASGHAVQMPGGHMFHGGYADIAEQVMRRLPAY